MELLKEYGPAFALLGVMAVVLGFVMRRALRSPRAGSTDRIVQKGGDNARMAGRKVNGIRAKRNIIIVSTTKPGVTVTPRGPDMYVEVGPGGKLGPCMAGGNIDDRRGKK